MSKTYRRTSDGQITGDGGQHYATPRYRPDSRRKSRHIVARGVHRERPDLERFGQAAVRAALAEKERGAGHGQAELTRSRVNRTRPLPIRPKRRPRDTN
jgi:hypothetical protein